MDEDQTNINPYNVRKRKIVDSETPEDSISLATVHHQNMMILNSIDNMKKTLDNLVKAFHSLSKAMVIPSTPAAGQVSGDLQAKFHEMYGKPSEKKFDTAIRESTILSFLRDKDNPSLDDKLIWIHHPHAEKYERSTTFLPRILVDILIGVTGPKYVSKYSYQDQIQVIQDNIRIQLSFILSNVQLHNTTHIPKLWDKIIKESMSCSVIITLISIYQELTDLLELLPDINKYYREDDTDDQRLIRKTSVNYQRMKNISVEWWWSNKMCVLKYNNELWLLPRVCLLELASKLADTISVLLYTRLASHSVLDASSYDIVRTYIVEICKLHIKIPDKFFDVIANLEGIVVAEILHRTEDWINKDLLDSIFNEVYDSTGVQIQYEQIYILLKEMTIPLMAEIGTLSKITGHPLVKMDRGAAKLFRRVREEFPVSLEAVANCINHIKKNYVLNFIAKYNRWPAVTLHEDAHPLLVNAKSRGITPNNKGLINQHGELELIDWAYVDVEKEIAFDYCENILPMLDDKAISVLRSQVFNTYVSKKRPNPRDTRLLLFYLFSDNNASDHVDYLRKYASSDDEMDLVLDHMVIRIVPKEKELKELFRGFGCKTLKDRCRSIVQEKNAARFLSFFSDEQAINISELELIQKIHALLELKQVYKHHKIYYVNFDASGWNNKFRHETVSSVMKETLDKIFDTPIFSKTQKHYEASKIYIPDDFYELWWDGQKGGIDGLNQDTWMITYLGQIKYAFEGVVDSYHLLAKGDDLRAAIPVPIAFIPKEDSAETALNFKNRVCDAAKKYGHEIKIQESYISENLFTFSKSMYFKKVPLSYCLRKIQKTHGDSNIFLPTLDSYISSSYSNSHSACQSTTIHIPQYIVGLFWATSNIMIHPIYKNSRIDEFVALTLIPSPVGGFPIIYLHNMFVRAESDLLSSFIALYKHCERNMLPIAPMLLNYLKIKGTDPKKNLGQLLVDPYSLPIFKPQGPEPFLRRLLRKRLMHSNIKPEVKEILSLPDHYSYHQFLDILDKCPIWWSKVFSAIYSSSVYSLADKLTMQFVTAKSLLDTFLACGTRRRRFDKFLRDALQKDRNIHYWRMNTLRGNIDLVDRSYLTELDCPTEITQKLRDDMWNRPVTTVTHPSVPHQIKLVDPHTTNSLHDTYNHFVLTIDHGKITEHLPDSIHYRLGKFPPFLGATTKTGNLMPSLKIMEKDPLCASILNLCMLHNHTNTCTTDDSGNLIVSNVPKLIEVLLKSYTDENVKKLAPFSCQKKSGTQTHRLDCNQFNAMIMPNGNCVLYTQCMGETNTHQTLRLDPHDFTVNFLHILCHAIVVSRLDAQSSKNSQANSPLWIVTADCNYCMKPIQEDPIFLPDKLLKDFHSPRLALSYVNIPATNILTRALKEFHEKYPTITEQSTTDDDFQKSSLCLSWHWMFSNWIEYDQSAVRYNIYRQTSAILSVTRPLLGQKNPKTLGETEIRILSCESILIPLSIFCYYDLTATRGCFDSSIIHELISTAHIDGLRLYNMFIKLHAYNKMSVVLEELSQLLGVTLPPIVLNNVEHATKYALPLLFKLGKTSLKDIINIPVYKELPIDKIFPIVSIFYYLEDIIILELLRDELLKSEPIEDSVMMLYHCYLYPMITQNYFDEQIQSDSNELTLRDRDKFNIDDISCVINKHHNKYKLLHYILADNVNMLDSILENADSESFKTALDDSPDMILSIILEKRSMSRDIDIIRSSRYINVDNNDVNNDIDMNEDIETLSLHPYPLIIDLIDSKLPVIKEIIPDTSDPKKLTKIPDLTITPNINLMCNIFGSLDSDYTIYNLLFLTLNLKKQAWNSVNYALILNDEDFLLLRCLTYLASNATYLYHSLIHNQRTPPSLMPGITHNTIVGNHKIRHDTLQLGLDDLTIESTWNELLKNTPSHIDLIIMRYNKYKDGNFQNLVNIRLCNEINKHSNPNMLVIIEIDYRNNVLNNRLLTILSYLQSSVTMLQVPHDYKKSRMFIISYGRRHNPLNIIELYPHQPNPNIQVAMENFIFKINEHHSNSIVRPMLYKTISSIKTMIGRLRGNFPHMKLRIYDILTQELKIDVPPIYYDQNWAEFRHYLMIKIKQEMDRKMKIYKNEDEEISQLPADSTFTHRLRVLSRIIVLHYLLQIITFLDPTYNSPDDVIDNLQDWMTIWNNLSINPLYSDYISHNIFGIIKHHNIRISFKNDIYLVYNFFYITLGTYWIFYDNQLYH